MEESGDDDFTQVGSNIKNQQDVWQFQDCPHHHLKNPDSPQLCVAPRSLARPPRRLSSTHPPSLDRWSQHVFFLYFDPVSVPCWQLGGRGGRFQRAQGDIFCEESLKNFHFDWRCTSLQRGRITACSSTTISDGWCPTATTCSRQACETFFSLFFLLEHEVGYKYKKRVFEVVLFIWIAWWCQWRAGSCTRARRSASARRSGGLRSWTEPGKMLTLPSHVLEATQVGEWQCCWIWRHRWWWGGGRGENFDFSAPAAPGTTMAPTTK